MTTATYLYCVVRASHIPSAAGVPTGVPDAARTEVTGVSRALWLIAASVPLKVYGSPNLETKLSDLEWVGRVALAHEAVVEHFAARRGLTVIPMKLFTLFSTTERAVADVAGRGGSIESAMKRIEGAEEWGVRVMRAAPAPAAGTAAARKSTTGAAFLAAKKQARDQIRDAKLAASDAAATAFQRLAAVSRDARRREDPPAAGATLPLLDAAFLVSLKDRDRFTQVSGLEADACARAGARMTVTGPWPAYNFVQVEDQ